MVLPRNFELHTPERLFAVDLMRHVYSQRNLTYLASGNFSRFGPYGDTPFRRNVREAIDFLRGGLSVPTQNLLDIFVSYGNMNGPAFGTFLRNLAVRISIDHFDMIEFLEYSAITSSLALLLFSEGIIESGNYAVEAIVDVVGNFKRLGFVPNLNELEVYAREFIEYWNQSSVPYPGLGHDGGSDEAPGQDRSPDSDPVQPDGGPDSDPVQPDGGPDSDPVQPDGGPDSDPVQPDGGPDSDPVQPDGGPDSDAVQPDGGPDADPNQPDGGPDVDSKQRGYPEKLDSLGTEQSGCQVKRDDPTNPENLDNLVAALQILEISIPQ